MVSGAARGAARAAGAVRCSVEAAVHLGAYCRRNAQQAASDELGHLDVSSRH